MYYRYIYRAVGSCNLLLDTAAFYVPPETKPAASRQKRKAFLDQRRLVSRGNILFAFSMTPTCSSIVPLCITTWLITVRRNLDLASISRSHSLHEASTSQSSAASHCGQFDDAYVHALKGRTAQIVLHIHSLYCLFFYSLDSLLITTPFSTVKPLIRMVPFFAQQQPILEDHSMDLLTMNAAIVMQFSGMQRELSLHHEANKTRLSTTNVVVRERSACHLLSLVLSLLHRWLHFLVEQLPTSS